MLLKYIPVITRSVEKETSLFLAMGFKNLGEVMLWPNTVCRFISLNDDSFSIILIPERPEFEGKRIIFLTTDNCLKDYLYIKGAGIKFSTDPYYAPGGLVAEFEDDSGNYFVLFEERAYEEI